MTPGELHLVVPGPLDQLTGGYVYDGHMAAGLRESGWTVTVHELPGRFPDADEVAAASLGGTLASLDDGARVVVDGLAMGGLPETIEAHGGRLRIVSMLHHPLAEETGLSAADAERFGESERRALAPCAGVIVSSEFTARVLDGYGVPREHIRVVVPGIEATEPAEGPDAAEAPLLLCVASVTPRKGHDVLVDALTRVRDLRWRCVCAGSTERDPAFAGPLMARVAEAGLADKLDFVGERHGDALTALYRGASVFVLASHYEGYGMALADALAHGLPVVSTTGGAIPFTVPPDAGLLVEPGDAPAFADALRTVLAPDGAVRAELGAAARSHAETLPSWREAAATFARAIEELTK